MVKSQRTSFRKEELEPSAIRSRMKEIMLSLRAQYFVDERAGRDGYTGVPLEQFGNDPITRAALQSWREGKYIKITGGMVQFDGMGFNEAFRIEERKDEPEQPNDTPDTPNMFDMEEGE